MEAGAAALWVGMSSAVRRELGEAMKRGYVAAYRLLRTPDAAHDACQEAAVRALAAADRYDPARPFYPWFHRILRNHCLDTLAGHKRMVSADTTAEPRTERGDAEAGVLDSEKARAVAAAIETLDEDLRDVIELRHFQDASYDEIATILDIPIGTVMSRLYRARKTLRKTLGGTR